MLKEYLRIFYRTSLVDVLENLHAATSKFLLMPLI
jgi:hypothetical protein